MAFKNIFSKLNKLYYYLMSFIEIPCYISNSFQSFYSSVLCNLFPKIYPTFYPFQTLQGLLGRNAFGGATSSSSTSGLSKPLSNKIGTASGPPPRPPSGHPVLGSTPPRIPQPPAPPPPPAPPQLPPQPPQSSSPFGSLFGGPSHLQVCNKCLLICNQ